VAVADAGEATLGKRERNKRDKLRRIKQAARRLFRMQGFEATTTQAIAAAAGIGAGTLFSYARVKEDLLLMVLVDDLVQVMQRAGRSAPAGAPLLERLQHFYEALLRFHARFAVRTPERRADLERLMQAVWVPTSQWIAAAQSAGGVRADADAQQAAWGFWAFYYGIVSALLNDTFTLGQARVELGRQFRCLFKGLAP